MKKIKLAVLAGGMSGEHEVSLRSGSMILRSLDRDTYDLVPVLITKLGEWVFLAENVQSFESSDGDTLTIGRAIDRLKFEEQVDLVFVALHGTYGEDGAIQGLLKFAQIPFAGSGILASALAMNKERSREIYQAHGLTVPSQLTIWRHRYQKDSELQIRTIAKEIGLPCVVKPNSSGSSLGVTIVRQAEDLTEALATALKEGSKALVQEFIEGIELTCGTWDEGTPETTHALPPVQIIPKKDAFYTYESKYATGGSDHLIPPNLDEEQLRTIQEQAVCAHQALGCSGIARTDFILSSSGKLYILETNTLPGMTETSLIPQEAEVDGVGFVGLLNRVIATALK